MRHRSPGAGLWIAVTLAGAAMVCGCRTGPQAGEDLSAVETIQERGTRLGGEAVAQTRQQMQRARRNMRHFHRTAESMRRRSDREGLDLLGDFLDGYMARHLDPMLRSEWPSRHPELMAIDVELRLLEAQLLLVMQEPDRVARVIDEIELRYRGRDRMVVEYPVGSQSTLHEALELLRARRWRG